MTTTSNHPRFLLWIGALLLLFVALAIPQRAEAGVAPPPPSDATCYANTTKDAMLRFACDRPGRLQSRQPITGIPPTEDVDGIEYRAADLEIYAVTTDRSMVGRLYTLEESTAVATFRCVIGSEPLNGASPNAFGVDFDPAADLLRIVSRADQNLAIDPDGGPVCPATEHGELHYANGDPNEGRDPGVTAAAYTTDFDTLADIDVNLDVASLQDLSSGALSTFFPFDIIVDAAPQSGFDIACDDEVVLAALRRFSTNRSRLYYYRLGEVHSRAIGDKGDVVRGLAIDPATCPGGPVAT